MIRYFSFAFFKSLCLYFWRFDYNMFSLFENLLYMSFIDPLDVQINVFIKTDNFSYYIFKIFFHLKKISFLSFLFASETPIMCTLDGVAQTSLFFILFSSCSSDWTTPMICLQVYSLFCQFKSSIEHH